MSDIYKSIADVCPQKPKKELDAWKFKLIDHVLSNRDLSWSGTVVGVALLMRLNTTDQIGRCDPSESTIAKDCGTNTRQVERAIRELKEHNYFTVTRRWNKSSQYDWNFALATNIDNASDTDEMSGLTPTICRADTDNTSAQSRQRLRTNINEHTMKHKDDDKADHHLASGERPTSEDEDDLRLFQTLWASKFHTYKSDPTPEENDPADATSPGVAPFDRFWSVCAHPRKKDVTRKLFEETVASGVDPELLIEAMELNEKAWSTTWLEERQWKKFVKEVEGRREIEEVIAATIRSSAQRQNEDEERRQVEEDALEWWAQH